MGFEIINLGRGEPVSLDRFIHCLQTVANGNANLKLVDPPPTEMLATYASNAKAKELLGFAPEISFEDGISNFWDWFVKNRICHIAENVA